MFVDGGCTSADRWGMLGPSSETGARVSLGVGASLCVCTHKNIYLSCVRFIYVCVEPEAVNYKELAVG